MVFKVDKPQLTVHKRLLPHEYAAPGVELEIRSECRVPVRFRLVEELPRSVGIRDVGFHREHGSESWSVQGPSTIVYEDVIREGKTVRTIYAVATADRELLRELGTEPDVEVSRRDWLAAPGPDDWKECPDCVEVGVHGMALADGGDSPHGEGHERDHPFGPDDDPLGDISRAVVRAAHSDETTVGPDACDDTSQSVNGASRTASPVGDGANGDGDLEVTTDSEGQPEPNGTVSGDPADAVGDTEGESAKSSNVSPRGEPRLVDRLAAELAAAEESDPAVCTLEDAVGSRDGSVAAKVDHCLVRIAEFDAYVDALEEFLDDEGNARQIISELRSDLSALENRLDDVESRVETLADSRSALEERVSETESSVAETGRDLEETEARVQQALRAVESDVESLANDVERVEEWRRTLADALAEAEADSTEQ